MHWFFCLRTLGESVSEGMIKSRRTSAEGRQGNGMRCRTKVSVLYRRKGKRKKGTRRKYILGNLHINLKIAMTSSTLFITHLSHMLCLIESHIFSHI